MQLFLSEEWEGVEDEYKLFKEAHPDVPVFPIASTGAASRILYFQNKFKNQRLLTDFVIYHYLTNYLRGF